jgi:hypothetical protein
MLYTEVMAKQSSKVTIKKIRKLSAQASVRRLALKPGEADAGDKATHKAGKAILAAKAKGVKLPKKLSTDSDRKNIRQRANQSREAQGRNDNFQHGQKEKTILPLYKAGE